MYINDNIAFAGNPDETLKVSEIFPLDNYKLKIVFNNGQIVFFDFSDLLQYECYKPLENKNLFDSVSLHKGVPVWDNGNIDIAPEYLYENHI